MADTMTATAGRPIGFGAAFVRQFKLLWSSRRPLLLAVALLAVLVLSGEPWTDDNKTRLLTMWPLWLVFVGPIWSFAVFHNEGPSNRLYHWSLPVNRLHHTLARLAAGLAWLWVLYGVLIGAGAIMGGMDGDLWQLGEISATGWVNFFTGPLLGFLAVSVLTVASDYPLRWFFGIAFLFPFTLATLDEWLGLADLAEAILEPLSNTGWGLFPVMIGGLGNAVMELERTLIAMTNPEFDGYGSAMEVTYWWTATPLWILLIAVIVALVASRHPDKLPRLRRSG